MTMHATLERDAAGEDSALFFAGLPDSSDAALVEPMTERSTYGADSGPSWTTILTILAAHVVLLYGLVTFDVIPIAPKTKVLVVDLIAEPPLPPSEKPKPEPVMAEKIKPVIEVPPPIVQTPTPPPPQISVTATPSPPKPVAVSAPPSSGPVTVGDLDERLLEGRPPRYPMESRRKKEQGTVVVRLLIGTDGRVQQISIAQSSGFDRLDQAALQAIRTWRWQPTIRDGQPVEVRGLYSMPFALQG